MNDKIINLAKRLFPFYKSYHKLAFANQEITYWQFIRYKMMGSKSYWCANKNCYIGMPRRLYIGKNSKVLRNNNFFQCSGGIFIGNYVGFATRVSLLSSNHDLYNQNVSHHKSIVIGDYCWLGMNTSILAGVTLGPRTIVANGAVVTKSFPEGMCILAGVPAKVVKRLDPELFKPWTYKYEFYGYLPSEVVENKPEYVLEKYLDPDFFQIKNNRIVPILKEYTK